MTERLCINCKHFREWERFSSTGHNCMALEGKTHPVFGSSISTIPADIMRMTLCGWSDPKLWEPKK